MNGRKIFDDIIKAGFDCALFLDEDSQYYLCDYFTTDGAVIVSKDETALLTDSRYIEAAENDKAAGKLSDDVNPYLFKKGLYSDIADYLCNINDQAEDMFNRIVSHMAEADGTDEYLKVTDQMKWVGLMNNYHHCAEEIVFDSIIYT